MAPDSETDETTAVLRPSSKGRLSKKRKNIYPRALPCGDSGLTVEFGETINVGFNDLVMALDRRVTMSDLPIFECVPTYRSLFIAYDGLAIDFQTISDRILELCDELSPRKLVERHWRVPVVYGGTFGIDFNDIAKRHALTREQLIEQHVGTTYRVYTVGFMPGFAYLGGLDPALATPRRSTPRLSIPEGSITIGGPQTAITSIEAPSGWHVIGRSPVRAFMAERTPACLFEVGDLVSFDAMPAEAWHDLSLAAYRGEIVASRIV